MARSAIIICLFLSFSMAPAFLPAEGARAAEPFRRGDPNDDGAVNLSDVETMLGFLFLADPVPPCLAAVDANADAVLDISDAVYLLRYLFQGGAAPPAPGPISCGVAPAGSDCQSYSHCGGPPEITTAAKALPAETLPGERVNLTVAATDPDADKLTYSWSQVDPPTPAGTFISGKTSPSAAWRSPAVGAPTAFTLRVAVSDPAGHAATGTVTVMIDLPHYGANIQPIWSAACSCHIGSSRSPRLDAGRSFASLVNVAAGSCRPLKYVLPSDPDNSELVKQITGSACGTRMPEGNASFFDTNVNQLIRIRSWILAGAAND
jgi:K319-like protein